MTNPNVPGSLVSGALAAGKKNVWIGTGSTPLELLEVKAQGKKRCAPPTGREEPDSPKPRAAGNEVRVADWR